MITEPTLVPSSRGMIELAPGTLTTPEDVELTIKGFKERGEVVPPHLYEAQGRMCSIYRPPAPAVEP